MSTTASPSTEPSSDSSVLQGLGQSIWGPSFQGLLWTNWLTALNDNAFRWFVIGVGKEFWAPEHHATVLALGTAFFVLPYLVFAVPAGWLADRFSKRQVIVGCKFAEIVIMSLAIFAIWCQSFEFLLAVVFLMGAQSALFAPSKVGTIPELLDEHKISSGNGLFNLATLSATILGMTIGGWLADTTQPRGSEHLWLTASILVGVAVVGTLISFFVTKLPAGNPTLRFPVNVPRAMSRNFYELYQNGRLFRVALGVVFFWAFASLAQINIDSFVDESGAAWETERTPLLVSLVLGVGFGSVLAGIFSRGKIELGLVPWAATGMTVFATLLYFTPLHFMFPSSPNWQMIFACGGLACLGMSGGFFDVPLASYLQERSPIRTRGAILAASNFMLFTGVLITSALFFALRTPAWEPSLARLPDAYQLESLSEKEQADVSAALSAFTPSVGTGAAAERMLELLPTISGPARPAAAAQLLFVDMKAKIAQGQAVTVDDYRSLITGLSTSDPALESPDQRTPLSMAKVDERLIKVVARASGRQPMLSSRQVFLTMGILTIPLVLFTVYRLGREMVTVGFYWLVRLLYRWRVTGAHNLPETGPAVLIANHSSWIDATLLMLSANRHVHMIAWAGNFQNWFMRGFANFAGIILLTGGPKSIVKGLKQARAVLDEGGIVGIFPEGGLSRNVQLKSFKEGVMKIVGDSDVPIIPTYIDETWGSLFSYHGGQAFKKFPNSLRRGLSVHFGEPIYRPQDVHVLRNAVQYLGAQAVNQRSGKFRSPVSLFIGACKSRLFKFKVGDSLGQKLSGGALLMRCLILRRLMRNHLLNPNEKNVGVLIPPSVGAVIVNLALALDKRVAVNLNYSVSSEIMDFCVDQAEIQHVLTTDKVMEKFAFDFGSKKSLLDDLRSKVTLFDKLICAVQAYVCPRFVLEWMLGLGTIQPDDVLTLVFTSGSTGKPKGVMLTHQNIASNVVGIEQVASLTDQDIFAGVLPFFHSFGYTVSLWSAMSLNTAGVYHISPLDARQVGKLVETYRATLLLATPTFLRGYLKRCTPEEFQSLDLVVDGAEKMPIELADAFEKRFGKRPTEGYGATELSPLVSVNVPDSRRRDQFQIDSKEGTVGRPIPNVAAKITDLDTGEVLGVNQPGMLWITGPNVMKGYLNEPEKTAEVVVDGWYKTGDVGLIDQDGFIKLTGRMSRFSKIGGEMVPHVAIEDELMRLEGGQDEQQSLAVTAVPDSRKGERLLVLYTQLSRTVEELRAGLSTAGFPNLFIPSADSFIRVESIPVLGTGKIDLKGLKDLALQLGAEQ